MSEALRPWIRAYFEGYVSKYNDLGKIHPQRRKVQILKFLTFPRTENEFLWASLSDKESIIPARFTAEALKMYNENKLNQGRPITGRSHAIAVINCRQILRCKPPLGPDKGSSPSWQIGLEIDEVDVIGCEGEPVFGNPSEFHQSSLVNKFLKGLADGLGNVLRKKPSNDERSERVTSEPISKKLNGLPISNGSEGSRRPASALRDVNFEERYRQWQHDIESLGLLRCYEHPEVNPEGNVSTVPILHQPHPEPKFTSPITDEIKESPPALFTGANYPTTPTQWSPSAVAPSSAPSDFTDTDKISSSRSSQLSSKRTTGSQNDTDETDPDEAQNDINIGIIDDHLPIRHTHEAKVLVPDSDISHSLSQPFPTQKSVEPDSLTAFVIPETSLDSHRKSPLQDKECGVPLGAAKQTSDADHVFPPGSQLRKKRKRSLSGTDENSRKPARHAEHNTELRQPTSPLHDPSIWKKPSFMASPIQKDSSARLQDVGIDQPGKSYRNQMPEADEVANAAKLKLGGWKPDWPWENYPGVMTYERLTTLLSAVKDERDRGTSAHNPG